MKNKPTYYHSATKSLLFLFSILLISNSFSQDLVLNEVMMKNGSFQSTDGAFNDWVEVFNNSTSPIQLNDYYLSDRSNKPLKWNFPDTILAPQSFIVLVASNLNTQTANYIHTNFTLSSNDETVYLSSYTSFLDSLSPQQTPTNLSFGRIHDGQPEKGLLLLPSFGTTNNANNAITPSSNEITFSQDFNLYLNEIQPDSIFYTTNGSDPSTNSLLYSGSIWLEHDITSGNDLSSIPTSATQDLISFKAWEQPTLPVKKCHVLKYASFKNGVQTSPTYAQTFIPDNQMSALNVISIITDSLNLFDNSSGIYVPGIHYQNGNPEWTGNFFQKGVNWNKTACLNYISNTGESFLNQKVEIKISGGKTRHAAQKSLAISAKSSLSDNLLRYNFFPNDKSYLEKSISLKTTFGDWGTQSMIKDILVHAMSSNLHVKTINFEFVDVYINGEFWGIQALRERNSSSNLGLIFDNEDLDINVLNPSSLVLDDGSITEFQNLKEFIEFEDLTITSNYEYVTDRIDMENFIDYYAIEMFFANYDWPVNNNKIWKSNESPDKWRQLLFDLDASFPVPDYNMLRHTLRNDPDVFWPNPANSTLIFRQLFKNTDFKKAFLKRFDELLKTDFSEEQTIERLEEIRHMLAPHVPVQIERWGYPDSFEDWNSDIDGFVDFLKERPCIMADHLNERIDEVILKVSCNLDYDETIPVTIFPNPTSQDVKIKFTSGDEEDVSIQLSSADGKVLYKLEFKDHHPTQVIILDLSKYAQGNYILKLDKGAQHYVRKVIKI